MVKNLRWDYAAHFTNSSVQQFNKLTNTRHLKSIPYRSQSNGICEHADKEVTRHLVKGYADRLRARRRQLDSAIVILQTY